MLRFIWYHYALWIVGGYAVTVALAFFSPLSFRHLLPPLLLYVALIYALASFYNLRVTAAYLNHCDPEPYLEWGLWGIRRFRRARTARERACLANSHIYANIGLGALGRYREALEHLDAIDRSALSSQSQAAYWQNRFAILLFLGEQPEELERLLDLAQGALDKSTAPARQRRLFERAIQYDRLLVAIQRDGPSQETMAQVEAHLFSAKQDAERVSCHFRLANMALTLGDIPAARVHLDYVITHGNKFYIRTQALEMLDKLNSEEGSPC